VEQLALFNVETPVPPVCGVCSTNVLDKFHYSTRGLRLGLYVMTNDWISDNITLFLCYV